VPAGKPQTDPASQPAQLILPELTHISAPKEAAPRQINPSDATFYDTVRQ
jgi:hypothetical protein